MARKKTRKKASKKKTTKRRKVTKRVSGKLPMLSTLVKQPKRILQAGVKRYETAIEIKDAPQMFKGGKRLFIGPKRGKSRRRSQKLPPEIAHIFE